MEEHMNKKIQKADKLHKRGYNCAQAVACTFCEEVGIDEATMFKLSEGFGAGIGGFQSTCGAVSGAVLVAGLKNSTGDLLHPASKDSTYKLSKQIVDEFIRMNGSEVCKDLKGIETNRVLRSCPGCIEDAVTLVEQIVFTDKK